MRVATWGLDGKQAKNVYEEIASGLLGETVSTPSSTGFGLELADTVCPLVWLVMLSDGPVESVEVPVPTLARKLATMVRVLFRTR